MSFRDVFLLIISISICSKVALTSRNSPNTKLPNIIIILADDLGYDDLGFLGASDIPTPNIDALAYSGLILKRYYSLPLCTPARSALLTGKHPIHTGMQYLPLLNNEDRGLPLTEKLMPEYLNKLGYSSHMVGKWHIGFYKLKYTPLYRGFKTHLGLWGSHLDYYDHTATQNGAWGHDIRRNLDVAYDLHGKYLTDVFTEESVRVISHHNTSSGPLFMYIPHFAPHTGNFYNPMPVPRETVAKMSHIKDFERRQYAAIMSKLDDSVGRIVKELQNREMLDNSIIIFASDNGGAAGGLNHSASSNWPLRGGKMTLFEGGVRCAGLLWSPRLGVQPRVAEQTIHVTDWLPTLLGAMNNEEAMKLIRVKNLDGYNLWPALKDNTISPRQAVLHNINDIWGEGALTVGDWKLIYGTFGKGDFDDWFGPINARDSRSLNANAIYDSPAGRAISSLNLMPNAHKIRLLHKRASVNCNTNAAYLERGTICDPLLSPCLFNVRDDPCEKYNLASLYPHILQNLLSNLHEINKTAIPPSNVPPSPNSDPRLWNNVWTNFGDLSASV